MDVRRSVWPCGCELLPLGGWIMCEEHLVVVKMPDGSEYINMIPGIELPPEAETTTYPPV